MDNSKNWQSVIGEAKKQAYFQNVLTFLDQQREQGKVIYPPSPDVFNAFKFTPFESIKAVILGQDPYHGPNQAHGLCFSVQHGVAPPPSLKNIFKELHDDLGIEIPSNGNLEPWTKQGVLLLNTVLTVEAGKPHSHANQGWEKFTDEVIHAINREKEGVIFLLWGSSAQQKSSMINANKHHILKATHPSPLSAYRGFLGSKPFSKTNALLNAMGKQEIDWRLCV